MSGLQRNRSWPGATLGLLVTVALCAGCSRSIKDDEKIGLAAAFGIVSSEPFNLPAKPSAKHDHILQVRATKNGSSMAFRPNRELWKPFRVEATLGFPDEKHAHLGADGTFGVSVLQTGGVGAFYIVRVKRDGEGIVVEVGTGGAQPLGTLALPGAHGADVAMETNPGLVIFSARKIGDAAYTPIAGAVTPVAGPYQMSLDTANLPKGTVVGFDLLRVVTNGAPAAPTAVQTARETIYTAIDALAEAIYAIDGDAPDRAKAGDQIDLAVTRLDAALAMDLSAFKTTRTKAAAARKKAASLVAGARGSRSANSVIASLAGIAKLAGVAADALE